MHVVRSDRGETRRESGRAAALLGIFVFQMAGVLGLGAAELPNPEELGPYPVGVTTLSLTDGSRQDPSTEGPRTLLTEIWYPAAEEARDLPKNRYSEFLLRGVVPGSMEAARQGLSGYRENFDVEAFEKEFKNIAVRDVRVREGKFPLIVFSHGNGGTRVGYIFFCEFMASHGYVVMSADHTGNSRFTFVAGKVVTMRRDLMRYAAENRPKDMSFLIDSMERMNAGADSRFAGRIDVENVGAAGMSFGGSTTMRLIEAEDRVKAAIMLAPGGSGGERANFTTPIMMMIGTEDSTVGERGNSRSRQYYEDSKGPRHLVEIKDAGHFTFTSVEQYNREYGNGIGKGTRITTPGEAVTYLSPEESHKIINAYALAFWGLHLKGQEAYAGFLAENHYGEKLIYKN